MSRGAENWLAAGTLVGIPAFAIVVLQSVRPVLPWHALLPALIIAIFLLVQWCVPWRHREWTDERLADVKRIMHWTNATLFCVFFLIAATVILAAFVWGQAPEWIEKRLEIIINSKRIAPVAVTGEATPLNGFDLPNLLVAEVSAPPTDQPSGALAKKLSLYPASAAIAAAIGSTKRFSDYASSGILVQAMFILFLLLGERIAEVAVRINTKEGVS